MNNSENPAFPSEFNYGGKGEYGEPLIIHKVSFGLTKREYFAAKAMQGVLSHNHPQTPTPNQAESIAMYAVQIADELLKELEKPNKSDENHNI